MAVTHLFGLEMGSVYESYSTGSPAAFSTVKTRSGGYSMSMKPTAGPGLIRLGSRASGGTFRNLYRSVRFYLRIDTLPSAVALLTTLQTSGVVSDATSAGLWLNSNGTFRISPDNAATTATSTNALTADGLWHRIDLDVGWNAGAGIRVFVDGVVWASMSTGTAAAHAFQMFFGGTAWLGELYIDDIVCYDSALDINNLTDYSLNVLVPTADKVRGNWVDANGTGTANIFQGLNNIPPVGAAATTLGTRIMNTNSAANADYSAECQSYDTVVPAGGTILAVQAVCNDAQGVTTGSPKAGGVGFDPNPPAGGGVVASLQNFDYGLPNGSAGSSSPLAMNTFQAGWGTHTSPVMENPTIASLAVKPVVYLRKITSTTREVDVDFAGIYVMWKPAAAPSILRPSVKAAGTFATKPVSVQAGGAFTEKQMMVKVGGAWVQV